MSNQRPNIILLMVDDMGFSDIGCYGAEIQTPHLDRLGREGVRFSQFYNGARCCPTRASLLTGLYAHQAGVGAMINPGDRPAYLGHLNDRCVTIAEALRPAGYRTLMAGKWHVGGRYDLRNPDQWRRDAGDPGHPIPVQRGFDEHYGILCGAASYFNPPTLIHNDRFIPPDTDDYYFTDALGDHACRMVRQAADDHTPFFLYWAPTAPHWPLHARPRDIERYRGKYAAGWDALRQARYQRLLDEGLIQPQWNLSPRDDKSYPWEEATDKQWEDLRMAVYAAQVDSVDQSVGRMLDTLEATGQADNTLFLFLSDNGACAEFLREDAETTAWPGHFALPTADGQGVVEVGNRRDLEPGADGTFMSYDLPWANASNTPFRRFKSWTHEGGIATPLIAHWPAAMVGRRIAHSVGHIIDLMPTILEAAGAAYPETHADRPVLPAEGRSLLPVITTDADPPRDAPLYWEHFGSRAVRDGQWKLVAHQSDDAWQLHDMTTDRTELHDLAPEHPAIVERLTTQWTQWAQRVGV